MPDAATPRIFVDETSIPLGQALAVVRDDVVFPGHPDLPSVPAGTIDEDWLPRIGSMDLVVIGRDRHIVTKPAELAAYEANRIRAFWISGKKDISNWETLDRVIRRWSEIERVIETRGNGPWFYGIHHTTVSPISVRSVARARPAVLVPRRPPVVGKDGQLRFNWKYRPPDRGT